MAHPRRYTIEHCSIIHLMHSPWMIWKVKKQSLYRMCKNRGKFIPRKLYTLSALRKWNRHHVSLINIECKTCDRNVRWDLVQSYYKTICYQYKCGTSANNVIKLRENYQINSPCDTFPSARHIKSERSIFATQSLRCLSNYANGFTLAWLWDYHRSVSSRS